MTSRKQFVSAQTAAAPAAPAEEEKKPSLFSNISPVQVVATGLAALTSMMLSSQIGVLGSVVSVFVSSAVSTVSAQIYKNVLAGGARKVKNRVSDGTVQYDAASGAAFAEPAKTAVVGGGHAMQAGKTTALPADATTVLVDADGTADSAAYAREALNKAHARRASKAKTQKMAVVIAVVSAFVAIGITAGFVNLTSSGNGWGEKTETIPTVSSIVAHHQAQTSSSSSSEATPSSKAGASNTSSSSSEAASSSSSSANGAANQSAASSSSSQQEAQTNVGKSSSSSSSSSNQNAASSSNTSSSSSSSVDSSSSTSSSSSSNASGSPAHANGN